MDVPNGLPRLLNTFPDADNVVPSWSSDRLWIYSSSNKGGETFQLWKVPANDGVPIQITSNVGYAAVESSDGFLYDSKQVRLG